jgi:hypothetical protein
MKKLAIVLVVLGILGAALCARYRNNYPLGSEHRCDSMLWFALFEYAEKHGGAFPSGEATPEASISLVHSLDPSGQEYAYLLHRRDVSTDVVRQLLQRGQLLDANTCGWNYVEGLRKDSNGKLALFWDKEGLGHNGERLSGGGHIVTFVYGNREHIPAAEWDAFLEEQQKLLATEKREQLHKSSVPNSDLPQDRASPDQIR